MRRPLQIIAVLVAVLVVAAVSARGALEGAIVRNIASGAGYDIAFDQVGFGLHGARLTNVRIAVPGETPVFTADRLDLGLAWSAAGAGERRLFGITSIDALHPHVDLVRRDDGTYNVAAPAASQIDPMPNFSASVRDGKISLERESSSGLASAAHFTGVNGTMHIAVNGAIAYAVHAAIDVAGKPASVEGSATADGAGGTVHHWTASALPLVALDGFVPAGAPLHALGGALTQLDVRASAAEGAHLRWTGQAHLTGGTFSIEGAERTVKGAHGLLQIADDGIATPKLEGMLGDAPLHVAGAVIDRSRDAFRWTAGSSDLARIGRLFAKIAAQPVVLDVRLESLAPGVAFAQVVTHEKAGPIVYSMLSVDPAVPTVRVGTAIAGDKIVSGGERTSRMAERVGAIGGVNGDYYDIGRTWEPQGIFVHDGTLLRSPADRYALAVHRDKSVTFDLYHFRGSVTTREGTFPLTQVNDWPARDVTLLTPEFGEVTPVASMTYVQMERVSGHRFRVTNIPPDGIRTPASYGLLFGETALKLGRAPKVGETVDVAYDTQPSLADVESAIGGGPLFVKDGAWFEDPRAPAPDERDVHWAVVGVGKLPDRTLLFMAVDGRHPARSVGMTRPEFGDLMIAYGATDAFALDSGGSATMVSRVPGGRDIEVRNRPSDDDGERWISDGLFVYSDAPPNDLLAPIASAPRR